MSNLIRLITTATTLYLSKNLKNSLTLTKLPSLVLLEFLEKGLECKVVNVLNTCKVVAT